MAINKLSEMNTYSNKILFTKQGQGFSVVEIIVAMCIMSLLAYAALPRLEDLMESFRKRNAEMMVLEDIRLSQATSVEQGCQGIFKVAADGRSYSFGCDYVPYDTNSPPSWDSVRFSRELPTRVTISQDALIIFNSRGQSIDETGAVATRTITMTLTRLDSSVTFNTGTLRPTGFFTYSS